MRIISNFKDYYDGFMDHNRKDPFVRVWVRNDGEAKVSKYKLEKLDEKLFWFERVRVWAKYLIVAGKVYPLIVRDVYNEGGKSSWEMHEEVFYDAKTFIDSFSNNHLTSHQIENVEKFFKEYPDMSELCL